MSVQLFVAVFYTPVSTANPPKAGGCLFLIYSF